MGAPALLAIPAQGYRPATAALLALPHPMALLTTPSPARPGFLLPAGTWPRPGTYLGQEKSPWLAGFCNFLILEPINGFEPLTY